MRWKLSLKKFSMQPVVQISFSQKFGTSDSVTNLWNDNGSFKFQVKKNKTCPAFRDNFNIMATDAFGSCTTGSSAIMAFILYRWTAPCPRRGRMSTTYAFSISRNAGIFLFHKEACAWSFWPNYLGIESVLEDVTQALGERLRLASLRSIQYGTLNTIGQSFPHQFGRKLDSPVMGETEHGTN